jgi:hypothetical protein
VAAIEALPLVIDSRREFARLYGAHRNSTYLIRPDGYVGYRSQAAELAKLRQYLSRILLGRELKEAIE